MHHEEAPPVAYWRGFRMHTHTGRVSDLRSHTWRRVIAPSQLFELFDAPAIGVLFCCEQCGRSRWRFFLGPIYLSSRDV